MEAMSGDGSGAGDGDRFPGRNNRGKGPWAQQNQDHQPLRKPRQSGDQNKPKGENMEEVVKNSTLSAEAAEFVPKFNMPVQQQQQQQQQQPVSWHNSGRHGGYNQRNRQYSMPNQHHYNQYAPNRHNQNSSQDYGYCDRGSGDFDRNRIGNNDQPATLESTLRQLEGAMRTLTMNPGRFDSLVPTLVDMLSPYLEEASQCDEIIKTILEQSIKEGNFRYSGARLCTHLDTIVVPNAEQDSSIFRETLISKCQKQVETLAIFWRKKKKDSADGDEEKKGFEFILFLAELVTQMETKPANQLGTLLVQLIPVVLEKPSTSSVKFICQALKLAGQTLERDSDGIKKDMDKVMKLLADIAEEKLVEEHICRMVKSVCELRNANWGRVPLTPQNLSSTIPEPAPPIAQLPDEPVHYGPDGNVLSPDECKFLQVYADEMDSDLNQGDPDWDEDDELAAAYEEFLKLPPNNIDDKQVRR